MVITAVETRALRESLLLQHLPSPEHHLPVRDLAVGFPEDGLDRIAESAVSSALATRRVGVRRRLVGLAAADEDAIVFPALPARARVHLVRPHFLLLLLVIQLLHQELMRQAANDAHEAAALSAVAALPVPMQLVQDELHELLHLGAGVLTEDLEQGGPDLPHVDVLFPRLLLQELDEGGEREGAVLEVALAASFPVLSFGIVRDFVAAAVAFVGQVDPPGLECLVNGRLQEGSEAEARLRSILVGALGALADLFLGLVDEAAAVAGIRDDGEPAALRHLVHKLSEVVVCESSKWTKSFPRNATNSQRAASPSQSLQESTVGQIPGSKTTLIQEKGS